MLIMTSKQRQWVGTLSKKIYDIVNPDEQRLDIDLYEVVRLIGGRIESLSDLNPHESIVKGKNEGENDKFIIYINKNNCFQRQRFSIAHEIGHLFLHMDFATPKWGSIPEGESYYRRVGIFTPVEDEASEFAASFLMPGDLFRRVAGDHRQNEKYVVKDIASAFNVSEEAAIRRGRSLGLWR